MNAPDCGAWCSLPLAPVAPASQVVWTGAGVVVTVVALVLLLVLVVASVVKTRRLVRRWRGRA